MKTAIECENSRRSFGRQRILASFRVMMKLPNESRSRRVEPVSRTEEPGRRVEETQNKTSEEAEEQNRKELEIRVKG